MKQERANLRCHHECSKSKWLRLGPIKVEMIWTDPQIIVFHDLLYGNECDEITENLVDKLTTWNSVDTYAGGPWTNVRVMKK